MDIQDKMEQLINTGLDTVLNQVDIIDKDMLFNKLYQEVKIKKKFDSYMDALSFFIQENDLSEEEIKNLVSPSLKQLILKEASDKSLLKKRYKVTNTVENFF